MIYQTYFLFNDSSFGFVPKFTGAAYFSLSIKYAIDLYGRLLSTKAPSPHVLLWCTKWFLTCGYW